MFTPTLRAIKQKFPHAKIDFLITQNAASFPLRNAPECNRIYLAKNRTLDLFIKAMQLRCRKYDLSIVTSGVTPSKGALFSKLAGAKYRTGEYRDHTMSAYTHQIEFDPIQHRSISNLKLAETALGELTKEKPFYTLQKSDQNFVDKLIEQNGWKGKKLFAIHAGSNKENDFRRWHAEYFVEVAKMLKKRLPDRIVYVISGPDEMDVSQRISREAEIPLVSGLKLGQVAALLSRSDHLLNSDSGLGHIASCFTTRIYTIFGPADERVTSPFTDNKIILTANPAPSCKPCLQLKERLCNRECLLHLKPEAVLEIVSSDIKKMERSE